MSPFDTGLARRLAECGLTRERAAYAFGMPYATFYKRIREHGLNELFNEAGNRAKKRHKTKKCRDCMGWSGR